MPAFFHNRLLMLVLMLGMGLGIASSVYAEAVPASAEAVEKLQDRVIELEKETAVLKAELGAKIDAQDKRIADGIGLHGAKVTELSNQTTQLGNYISYTSLALVVIGLLAGVFAFRRAEQIAKDQSEQWFEKNERGLHERIQHLQEKVNEVVKHAAEAKCLIEQCKQSVSDGTEQFHQTKDELLAQLEVTIAKGEKPSAEVAQQVAQDARDLNAKPRTEWTVEDFYNAGFYSYASGDYTLALSRWDAVITMLADNHELDLLEQAAKARFNKGLTFELMSHFEEGLAAYEDLISHFVDRPELALREWVVKAMVNKGSTLEQLNRNEDALSAYDDVLSRFGDSPELALREQVAMAMGNKGLLLSQMGHNEDALKAYKDMLSRFGDSPELVLREQVAMVLIGMGNLLGLMSRHEDAVPVYDDIFSRFGCSLEPALREWVAKALFNKALILRYMDRPEDARAAFEKLLSLFGNSTEPELLEVVEQARLTFGGKS